MERKTNRAGGVVRVRVPATSANLGPGFDSLGIALTMYNELELELYREEKFDIESFGEGADMLPTDGTNMIWSAVRRLLARIGQADEYRGMKLRMYSRIPVSRGLGSSAAAIVGGSGRLTNGWGGRWAKRNCWGLPPSWRVIRIMWFRLFTGAFPSALPMGAGRKVSLSGRIFP